MQATGSAKQEQENAAEDGRTWNKAGIYSSQRRPRQAAGGIQVKEDKKTEEGAQASFSKPASAVSCCSGPLMPTRTLTRGKNPHGTQPETSERVPGV